MITCTNCDVAMNDNAIQSGYKGAPFVCARCRCADCDIVFGNRCECGSVHGKRSTQDRTICTECVEVRQRVYCMEPDLLALRQQEFVLEAPLFR